MEEDPWLALLLREPAERPGATPPSNPPHAASTARFIAAELPRQARSRSPVLRSTLHGPEEDDCFSEMSYYKLNVIEPTWEETPPQQPRSRPAANYMVTAATHQKLWSSGPVVPLFYEGAAAAAGRRACAQMFGTSNSIWQHAAAFNYIMGGSVAHVCCLAGGF